MMAFDLLVGASGDEFRHVPEDAQGLS